MWGTKPPVPLTEAQVADRREGRRITLTDEQRERLYDDSAPERAIRFDRAWYREAKARLDRPKV